MYTLGTPSFRSLRFGFGFGGTGRRTSTSASELPEAESARRCKGPWVLRPAVSLVLPPLRSRFFFTVFLTSSGERVWGSAEPRVEEPPPKMSAFSGCLWSRFQDLTQRVSGLGPGMPFL